MRLRTKEGKTYYISDTGNKVYRDVLLKHKAGEYRLEGTQIIIKTAQGEEMAWVSYKPEKVK